MSYRIFKNGTHILGVSPNTIPASNKWSKFQVPPKKKNKNPRASMIVPRDRVEPSGAVQVYHLLPTDPICS